MIAFSLFFSSEKVQTRVANSITKQLNSSFETNIKIGSAKIDLSGRISLGEVLIRDHKKDTLFYVRQLKLKLNELEGVLKGDYQFSSLGIAQPYLSIKTYQEEQSSNLQQFLNRLKRSSKKQKPFLVNVDQLNLENARLILTDQNKASSFGFKNINASIAKILLNENQLTGQIAQLNYQSPHVEDLTDLKAKLNFTKETLHLEDFEIVTPNGQMAGELKINTPKFSLDQIMEEGMFLVSFKEADLSTTLFNSTSVKLPSGKIKFNGVATGPLDQLKVKLTAQTDKNSRFEGDLLLRYSKEKGIFLKGRNVVASIDLEDVDRYTNVLFPQEHPIHQFNLARLELEGAFDFRKDQSFTSSLSMVLNEGTVKTAMQLEKQGVDWTFAQQLQFNDLGKGNLFKSLPSLDLINGKVQLTGTIKDSKLYSFDWDSQLNSLQWNSIVYQNISLNGKKDAEAFDLALRLNDPRIILKSKVSQELLSAEKKLVVKSEIERLDLSAYGWTPPDDDVRLATHLTFIGNQNALKEVRFQNTLIESKEAKNDFMDFALYFSSINGLNKVTQEGSDLFQFSLAGKFTYQNLPRLLESSIREALLLPYEKVIAKEEQFEFGLTLNKKALQALYPAVETPNNISLKGKISSIKGASSLSFDLPYILYEGYTVEGLSLNTLAGKSNDLTQFKADRVKGNNINISQVEFFIRAVDEKLKGQFTGGFGLNNINQFAVDFTYDQTLNNGLFQLDQAKVDLDGDLWQLTKNKRNNFIYNSATKEFIVNDLALSTVDQSFEINGAYQTKDNFSLKLATNQLTLEKILPKGDKFNFKGTLSSSFSIIQGQDQQLLDTDLKVESLVINGTPMGDFSLEVGGSSQLKTYQVETSLRAANKALLSGSGNIFMSDASPKVDVDLQLEDLDMSFLSALGKGKITEIKGFMSGDLNLWGALGDLKIRGDANLNQMGMYIPSTNTRYQLVDNTKVQFRDRLVNFNNASLIEKKTKTSANLNGSLSHINFNAWEMDIKLLTNRFLVYDRPEDKNALFYGHGYLTGEARFNGPTKSLILEVVGSTAEGTTLVIPWQEDKGLSDTSFIDYYTKGSSLQEEVTADISAIDEAFRGFEMIFDLDVNRNAKVEIVVDQSSGSTLSGRGAGNILIETNIDGKFNIWGDFIAYEGIYNFKNLGLIDKKFAVEQGGTIVWEGDPLEAQLNIEATYQVPGGANPALLVDNPNFNRKIPTNVGIQLVGNLIKPDDPVFDISFPNTTGIVVSEINYRLADQQRRQLQAISLLSQGIFISDVSVSFQGITNNLYEKASDVFSTLLGSNQGKLNVGLNYLQGEENPAFDLRTEDRIGLTLSTQLSDRILINGKIGVPIDGLEQSVIVGDVQIDFILNESGSLKAKVFNRENDFRYLGDEFGYTQGMGMSYQVDFNTFQELLNKIKTKSLKSNDYDFDQTGIEAVEYVNKNN